MQVNFDLRQASYKPGNLFALQTKNISNTLNYHIYPEYYIVYTLTPHITYPKVQTGPLYNLMRCLQDGYGSANSVKPDQTV